jgi:small subunit ribosomal protein S3
MGQKVKPIGLRLGINRTWDSLWIAGKDYPALLKEDAEIREFLTKKLKSAAISKITIERPNKKCRVFIHTARPGVIIGKKGADIENLRKEVQKKSKSEVVLNIVEVRKPDLDAKLIADSVADQIERRIAYRRAMKRAVQNAMGNGAKGVRIRLAGRLAGAEIARVDWYIEGSLPLHTLRADIDYGMGAAHTTYGVIGIQVWVNQGEKYAIDYQTNVQ